MNLISKFLQIFTHEYWDNLHMADYKKYVVGLVFDEHRNKVALIRKNRPAWQAGKLNGLGGKVEENESFLTAMIREFKEESGVETNEEDWKAFCDLQGEDFFIRLFASIQDLSKLKSVEDEQIEIVDISDLSLGRNDCVENLVWMVGIALNHLDNGRPIYTYVEYPEDLK